MSTSTIKRKQGLLPGGNEASGLLERGTISFGAGDATHELAISMRYIETFLLTAAVVTAGTPPDADQFAYLDETADSEGGVVVPSTGKVTIGQVGGSPVAMKYHYLAIGR